jgi:hypothetical protein
MKNRLIAVLLALSLLTPLIFCGCNSVKDTATTTQAAGEGFAIYLTLYNMPVAQMHLVEHYYLAALPYISLDNIVSYDKNTHEIELTADGYQKVTQLQVPTSGLAFVVCVDKKPIYWGAFWTPISSQSFDGVVIMVPPFPPGELAANTIQIQLGYPSPSFFQGEDPRSNPEIMASLETAGKLK